MNPDIPLPRTLRPNRAKVALQLVFSAGGVGLGVYLLQDGDTLAGYILTGLCGVATVINALYLFANPTYLHLDAEGFTVRRLYQSRTIRWADVETFGVIRVTPFNPKMVVWNHTPAHSTSVRALSRNLCGYEAAMPDNFGMKHEDLAALLNRLRDRYGPHRLEPANPPRLLS
jgi:hypothetical protein